MKSVVTDRTFIIGTRGSRLALAQTQLVVDALREAHPGIRLEIREITTQGDRSTAPLSEIGGQGVFTKAIEDALLRGEIDIAVHSMKDLPPRLTEGLIIAAVPERASPLDALLTRDGSRIEDLTLGARIGTGSGRRAAQVRAMRPDLAVLDIRGNVPTRIRKMDEGEYDGVVLAVAGLARLNLENRITQTFSVMEMTPSAGQGALAVEVRADDPLAMQILSALDHTPTRVAVTAERAFLAALGAGCTTPVGAHAEVEDESVTLAVAVAKQDGQIVSLRTQMEHIGTMRRGGENSLLVDETRTLIDLAAETGERAAQTVREAGWLADREDSR